MNLKDFAIIIVSNDDFLYSKNCEKLYHHYEHYRNLYHTDKRFKQLLLGYDLENPNLDWNKKINDVLNLLTIQENVIFENGNTKEEEIENISIIYLPLQDLSFFQIQMLENWLPKAKELQYLQVYKRTEEKYLNLTELYQKKGHEVLTDIIDQYYNHSRKGKS